MHIAEELIKKAEFKGKIEILFSLVKNRKITVEKAAKAAAMSVDEFLDMFLGHSNEVSVEEKSMRVEDSIAFSKAVRDSKIKTLAALIDNDTITFAKAAEAAAMNKVEFLEAAAMSKAEDIRKNHDALVKTEKDKKTRISIQMTAADYKRLSKLYEDNGAEETMDEFTERLIRFSLDNYNSKYAV